MAAISKKTISKNKIFILIKKKNKYIFSRSVEIVFILFENFFKLKTFIFSSASLKIIV